LGLTFYRHILLLIYLIISSYFFISLFFFNDTATTEIYTLSLHDALPIFPRGEGVDDRLRKRSAPFPLYEILLRDAKDLVQGERRSEEHTSELQSRGHLVCRLLLEKKKNTKKIN